MASPFGSPALRWRPGSLPPAPFPRRPAPLALPFARTSGAEIAISSSGQLGSGREKHSDKMS
eukprot:7251808-Pyramimonas_sp.AAC.1